MHGKKRLYLAVYPSGIENMPLMRYHYGFIIGPKEEKGPTVPGLRAEVKYTRDHCWEYDSWETEDVRTGPNLLARILIAKITDLTHLLEVLVAVPLVQGDPSWMTLTWAEQALGAIEADGNCVGTSVLDWDRVDGKAREYVDAKTEAGRYDSSQSLLSPKPTYCLLQDKELVK